MSKWSDLTKKIKEATLINKMGFAFAFFGVISLLFHKYPNTYRFSSFIKEVYANIGCELLSISITILIVNYLYEKREAENNKKRLIRELGSTDKGFTSRALKEIKELGYLVDGTLNNADLTNANLEGLDFSGAILNKPSESILSLRMIKRTLNVFGVIWC